MFPKSGWKSSLLLKTKYSVTKKCVENSIIFSRLMYKATKKKVLEACAIAAYHQSTDIPVVTTLLSDNAPQFKQIAYLHALCWIHDGRNYKKLRPIVPYYQEKLEAFLDNYWDFYGELCEFREKPDSEVAKQLSAKFDQFFSTKQDMSSWMKESVRRKRIRNIC